jgi:hypothetical protein
MENMLFILFIVLKTCPILHSAFMTPALATLVATPSEAVLVCLQMPRPDKDNVLLSYIVNNAVAGNTFY